MARDSVMPRFISGLPVRMEPATDNPRLQAVIIDADDDTGRASRIERLDWSLDDIKQARAATDDDEPV